MPAACPRPPAPPSLWTPPAAPLAVSRVLNHNFPHDDDDEPLFVWVDALRSLADFDMRRGGLSVCAGCQQDIKDRFILRVHPNLEFHAECLKCSDCSRFLDETCTAFVKEGRTLCKDDYLRQFGTRCARCAAPFARSEMVMRARELVFHLDCFKCLACDRRLATGDEFHVKADGRLFCRHDCEVGNVPETDAFDDDWETSTLTSLDGPVTSTPPLCGRSPKSDEGVVTTSFHSSATSHTPGVKKGKKDKQTTRVRTVLNEQQLAILKKCYQVNARPDALVKEQLVEMTGLNARVIRVWFQNKRCKDKKRQIQMRDHAANLEKERAIAGVRMNGLGPLLAASPAPHVDGLGPPLDIAHFPQNPALWADSAVDGPPPNGVPPPPPGGSLYDPMSFEMDSLGGLATGNFALPPPFAFSPRASLSSPSSD